MSVVVRASVVVAVLTAVLVGCSSEPETFTLHGKMTIGHNATGYPSPGCHGYQGYADINEGTAVTVYDAAAKVVAAAALAQGAKTALGGCEFAFSIPAVPAGQKFYQVEVSHRGKVAVDEEKARVGQVSLSLS